MAIRRAVRPAVNLPAPEPLRPAAAADTSDARSARPATGPTSSAAASQQRYQLRRLCLTFLVHGADPMAVRAGILEKHGLELSEAEVLALCAESRMWQREQHAARKGREREDTIDRLFNLLPTLTGSARIQAEALLAKIHGVEAPVEIRATHELAPEVLEVLGASSPDEVARYVARGLAKRDGEK